MVAGPQSLSDRLGKGHALWVPSRLMNYLRKQHWHWAIPQHVLNQNCILKGKKNPNAQVILVLLPDGYQGLFSNKMTHIIRYLSKQTNMLNSLQKGTLLRDHKRKQWSEPLSASSSISQRAGHRFCTGCRRWERISGSGSYFANSWNLVILSLEKDLADIYNGRLGSSGGETDGGLLILHTVKNYTVAPDQSQHTEKTNQHSNTSRGEIRTKGKSKPMKISLLWHNSRENNGK